jgi:hypothetical protein
MKRAFGSLPDARFIVHAGDLVDVGDRDQQWGEWFWAADWAAHSIPSLPTPGNHEYSADAPTKGLSPQWRPQFALPENGPADLTGAAGTAYFLDYQGLRLISLDSNLNLDVQAAWLRDVLRDNPNRWTVATFHHPVFSTAQGRDNKALREKWLPILDQQVDLVLQGHDHTYGRGHVAAAGNPARGGGAVYVNSVSGPKMYELSRANWDDNGAVLVRSAEQTQLYQLIYVAGDTLRYDARTATGLSFDSFSLTRLPNGAKLLREADGREVMLGAA